MAGRCARGALRNRVGGAGSLLTGPALVSDPDLVVYDTASIKGIDPIVQLGTLEGLLTDRPYEEVVADPRSGKVLAIRDEGERVVTTLTDSLASALAEATDGVLEQVAGPWSKTEEFRGFADPGELADVLQDLAGVARRAAANGDRLYCWICV